MPIMPAKSVPMDRPTGKPAAHEASPAWARPQVAWPFRVSKPMAARMSGRPSVPSFSS